ncbi:preprotein translocase subunit YajC [Actinoalloteichus spitiensis]|uniref:preprotein translocase subunit YajC n=1 Tax=Actinoalloteichus spitiensis TaxID=252394 RepID=UPI000379E86D|nr:preprotein translocase subunit YajC [Actinoalloteichus spitiensis]
MESFILPLFLLLIVLPLFLASRKQKKAMQEMQQLQGSLEVGDKVMTTSGLYATVADTTDDETIGLEVAPGVVTTWVRAAVRERVQPPAEASETTGESTDETVGLPETNGLASELADDKDGSDAEKATTSVGGKDAKKDD